jgi:predicted DNA-binding protein (MmcQ/YjbR family)
MIDAETFRKLALEFEEVIELPHFAKASFRVNKRIFATLDEKAGKAIVKLSEVEQSVFCGYEKSVMYPVNGSWGKQGWTAIDLQTVSLEILTDALSTSYCNVAPPGLSEKYKHF